MTKISTHFPSDMPRSYIYRMVAMEFHRPVSENALPIAPEVKAKLSPDDLQRLTRAKSSVFKFERFADLLSPEEMDEKAQEEERRNEVRINCGPYYMRKKHSM